MESQKIINLLDSNGNESQKFATKDGTLLIIKTLVKIILIMIMVLLCFLSLRKVKK